MAAATARGCGVSGSATADGRARTRTGSRRTGPEHGIDPQGGSWQGHRGMAPRRETAELAAALGTGAGHLLVELLASTTGFGTGWAVPPQFLYNGAAALGWAAYLARQLARGGSATLRAWGMGRAGFAGAAREAVLVAGLGAALLLAWGRAADRLPLPRTFWLLLALYPLYGLGQQFVLQALVTRNLRPWLRRTWVRTLAAAGLFSLVHAPAWPLVGLTFAAGVPFTLIYERHRNLWPVGVAHGLLGALAYHLVLGADPGADLLRFLGAG